LPALAAPLNADASSSLPRSEHGKRVDQLTLLQPIGDDRCSVPDTDVLVSTPQHNPQPHPADALVRTRRSTGCRPRRRKGSGAPGRRHCFSRPRPWSSMVGR